MSSNNQINDITGIIKLLGERILKIERTLLYYNKHIKEVEDSNQLMIKNYGIILKRSMKRIFRYFGIIQQLHQEQHL